MQLRTIRILQISLVATSLVSCGGGGWVAPESWTLREDGHLRASQHNEDFTIQQFIEKIKKEEGQEYAVCLTPKGEDAIASEIIKLNGEITDLKNQLSDCKSK